MVALKVNSGSNTPPASHRNLNLSRLPHQRHHRSTATMSLLDPEIFSTLQSKLEEETVVRESLSQIIERLNRAVATAQALLSRVHSTPRARCASLPIHYTEALSSP